MNNVLIDVVRNDILDRITYAVASGMMSEPLRILATSAVRIDRAISNSYSLFCKNADAGVLSQTAFVETLTAISTQSGYTEFEWPSLANTSRPDSGLIGIKTADFWRSLAEQIPLPMLIRQAQDTYYSNGQQSFSIDPVAKKIYGFKDVAIQARVISEPMPIMPKEKGFFTVTGSIPTTNQVNVDIEGRDQVVIPYEYTGSNENAAKAIAQALNQNGFTTYRSGTTIHVNSNEIVNATLSFPGVGSDIDPVTVETNSTGSLVLPISNSHLEQIVMVAYRELIKMAIADTNLDADMASTAQSTQPNAEV